MQTLVNALRGFCVVMGLAVMVTVSNSLPRKPRLRLLKGASR